MTEKKLSRFDVADKPHLHPLLVQLSRIVILSQRLEKMMVEILYCVSEESVKQRAIDIQIGFERPLGFVWTELEKKKLKEIEGNKQLKRDIKYFLYRRNYFIHTIFKFEYLAYDLYESVEESDDGEYHLHVNANELSEIVKHFEEEVYEKYEGRIRLKASMKYGDFDHSDRYHLNEIERLISNVVVKKWEKLRKTDE